MRDLFEIIYADFMRRRDNYIKEARFGPWFKGGEDAAYPPVIGFGLPRDEDERIPLVTVATNPSTFEFDRGHLLPSERVDDQWREQTGYFELREGRGPYRGWFDFSNDLVTELRDAGTWWSHYELAPEDGLPVKDGCRTNPRVPHLDLTPIITHGPLKTIDKSACDKTAGETLLNEGIQYALLPMLERLVQNHGTRLAIFYDWTPSKGGTGILTRTLRGLFTQTRASANIGRDGHRPPIEVAKAVFNLSHALVDGRGDLGRLAVVFCSHGPSYLGHLNLPRVGSPPSKYSESMTEAGQQIREWFPETWWSSAEDC